MAWDGNDGLWSTFTLGVGSPPQFVRVLVGTSAAQPWTVLQEGCIQGPNEPPFSVCEESRGRVFYPENSTTLDDEGNYTLGYPESLGIFENGQFFLDNLTLGVPGSESGSYRLNNQLVAGIATKAYYIAIWGIRPASTNLTTLNNNYPSVLSRLKNEGLLPSLSWAYTAGSYERFIHNERSFGSLTLGGYDRSRFEPHDVQFNFAANPARDLVVGIQSITLTSSTTENANLLQGPINALIDAGVSHVWVDEGSCRVFESAFQLTYNEDLGLYLVPESAHEDLVRQNLSLTFQLANNIDATLPVNITIPYAAFDLNLTTNYPGMPREARYFPLRCGANSSQYIIGRVFLQYAYVIADYERSVFSVHQARFPNDGERDIQTIEPIAANNLDSDGDSNDDSGLQHLGTGPLVGIVVGILVALFAAVAITMHIRHRRKIANSKNSTVVLRDQPEIDSREVPVLRELHSQQIPIPELAGIKIPLPTELAVEEPVGAELRGNGGEVELDGERVISYELEGCQR